MRRHIATAAALGALAWSATAGASADGGCTPQWQLSLGDLGCTNVAMLAPGNDTRVNLMLLLGERSGAGLPVKAAPTQDQDSYGFGRNFISWVSLRNALFPPNPEVERRYYGNASRCGGLAEGDAAFAAAVAANRRVTGAEREQLIAARARLKQTCEGRGDKRRYYSAQQQVSDVPLIDWPTAISSKPGQEFLAYLKASDDFYAGQWNDARTGFAALDKASDAWVADTAAYMQARVELNAAVAPALDQYGFFDQKKVDLDAVTRAGQALTAYYKTRPGGHYASSALGLVRRVQWLAGDTAGLGRVYGEMFAGAPITQERSAELIEEIDVRLFESAASARGIDDPLLLATYALKRMREYGYVPGPDRWHALTAAELEALAPRFAGQPDLFGYLQATHAFYIGKDMPRVLQLLPDDARKPSYSPLAFSRQVLRGMALATAKDRNEAGFWRELLGGAKAPWQREIVELGLAMSLERSGKVNAIFAKDSPIQDTIIRQILLQYAAAPELLRQQAGDATRPAAERDLALFNLLHKQLAEGSYASFVSDSRLIRRGASVTGSMGSYGSYQTTAVGLFAAGRWSDGYACAPLPQTAAQLARNPRDVQARLCLGDFWRLNGFDRMGQYDPAPKVTELGGFAHKAGPKPIPRGQFYKEIIADPAASANDKAYALYRSVMCYAPSGYNDCGGEAVAVDQRRAWFNQLKRQYAASPWAKKAKGYW